MVYTSMTHHYVFDYHDGEIYWCTADVGWVTGQYVLSGTSVSTLLAITNVSLTNGGTSLTITNNTGQEFVGKALVSY